MTGLRARVRDFAYAHAGGTALVLIYHRVAELERDPQLLAVSPDHFEAHVSMLAATYRVVPLDELIGQVRRRKVPGQSVAITFDDGYADNLTIAEPILAARDLPATVFVCSGYAATQREFWWHELEHLLLVPGDLPETIALETPSDRFHASLADSLVYAPEDAARDRAWNMFAPATNARQRLYLDLAAFMRPLSGDDRESALAQLRAVAGTADLTPRGTHRPLTTSEVATLDSSPMVDIGAHTVHHPVLSSCTSEEQVFEILTDRDALSGLCRRPLTSFSYPYGALGDYTDETVGFVRDAGFLGACSNHPGVVKPWTDPFRLPRNLVRDWDAETLAEKIEGWFRGPR